MRITTLLLFAKITAVGVCLLATNGAARAQPAPESESALRSPFISVRPVRAPASDPRSDPALIAFSPDGKTAASAVWFMAIGTAGSTEKGRGAITLLDVATGKAVATLKGHREALIWLAFCPNGKTLASCSSDGTVRLWQAASGNPIATLAHRGWVFGGWAFSRDGKTLALASGDGPIRLWETATGKSLGILNARTTEAWSLAFSPDGKTLASGHRGNTYVKFWDLATKKETANLEGHTQDCYAGVHSLAFSPDGKALASAAGVLNGSGEAKLWDVPTGKNTHTLTGPGKPPFAVAFSPDGKTLATASTDKTITLWDPSMGKARAVLGGSEFASTPAWAFSPDSKTIAVGVADGTVALWDVATAKPLGHRKLHAKDGRYLAFTPDGKTVLSGSLDGTIKLWAVER